MRSLISLVLFGAVLLCGLGLSAALTYTSRNFIELRLSAAHAGSSEDERNRRQIERTRRKAERKAERARREAERSRRDIERRNQDSARKDTVSGKTDENLASQLNERKHSEEQQSGPNQQPTTNVSNSTGNNKASNEERENAADEQTKAAVANKDINKAAKEQEYEEIVESEAQPPVTLTEFLKKLLKPTKPSPASPKRATVTEFKPSRVVGNQPLNPPQEQQATSTAKTTRKYRNSFDGWSVNFSTRTSFKENEILAFDLKPGTLTEARRMGFRIKSQSIFPNLAVAVARLQVPEGMHVRRARKLLRNEMQSNGFTLNHYYRIAGDNCGLNCSYGQAAIEWRPHLAGCSAGLRVGVIDTGLDLAHQTFSGRSIHVGQFLTAGRSAGTTDHGTGVVALLAGHPRSSTPGLLPDAEFFAADVFHEGSTGEPIADTVSLLKALDWMSAWNVNIVNMSLTGPKDELVEQAIKKLTKKGTIIVAAAGNSGPYSEPKYPAAYRQVISVTAVDKNFRVYRHANRGRYLDVAAPGVQVWTAKPNNQATFRSGTSFAVPYVTAILALAQANTNGGKSPSALLASLSIRDLGPVGHDQIYGHGLLLAPRNCEPVRVSKQQEKNPFANAVSSASQPSPPTLSGNHPDEAWQRVGASLFSFGENK